jgi:hypothetical protein
VFNPLAVKGHLASDDAGDPLRLEPTAYLSAIKAALEAKSAVITEIDERTIEFKPAPRSMFNGFLLAGVSQGVITTSEVRDRLVISYRLEVPYFILGPLFLMVLAFFMMKFDIRAQWNEEKYWGPLIGFLWLYGGNYIILMVRFWLFVGRTIRAAAVSKFYSASRTVNASGVQ